jgi:uncharacterized membrane protein HdeD (DUF308 family)
MHEIKIRMEDKIADNRGWHIFQSIVFIIAGILAFILPVATVTGLEILIGILLITSGFIQAFASFMAPIYWWVLFSALLSITIGGIMLYMPLLGVIALATLVTIFLFLEAIFELFLAYQFRSIKRWWWLLIAGGVTLLLAFFLLAGWPNVPVLFLGIMIGINFLLYGIGIFALAVR